MIRFILTALSIARRHGIVAGWNAACCGWWWGREIRRRRRAMRLAMAEYHAGNWQDIDDVIKELSK